MPNLKAEMRRHGITIQKIADLIGVTYMTAWNKLNGKTEFYLSEAREISKLFDEPLDYLFERGKHGQG